MLCTDYTYYLVLGLAAKIVFKIHYTLTVLVLFFFLPSWSNHQIKNYFFQISATFSFPFPFPQFFRVPLIAIPFKVVIEAKIHEKYIKKESFGFQKFILWMRYHSREYLIWIFYGPSETSRPINTKNVDFLKTF